MLNYNRRIIYVWVATSIEVLKNNIYMLKCNVLLYSAGPKSFATNGNLIHHHPYILGCFNIMNCLNNIFCRLVQQSRFETMSESIISKNILDLSSKVLLVRSCCYQSRYCLGWMSFLPYPSTLI